jgi:hypothetical protein
MKSRVLFSVMSLLLILPAAGTEGGKLDVVGKFVVSGGELDVATNTDAAQKIGLLGIAKREARLVCIFRGRVGLSCPAIPEGLANAV